MSYSNPIRRKRIPITIPAVSANWLKNAGALLTLVYFLGLAIQNGVLHASEYSSEEFAELVNNDENVFMFSGISSVFYLIGVAAIPIFSFLLVQGITHTSNVRLYVIRVLVLAALSEIPYDYAVSSSFFNMKDQNPLWTVLIALIMLWLLNTFQGKGMVPFIINAVIIFGGCFWAVVLNCKFGGGFILLTAIMFVLREKKGWCVFLGVILCLIYATAPIGFIPVALYSGERKQLESKSVKYFYYVFYLVMMILLAVGVAVLNYTGT